MPSFGEIFENKRIFLDTQEYLKMIQDKIDEIKTSSSGIVEKLRSFEEIFGYDNSSMP